MDILNPYTIFTHRGILSTDGSSTLWNLRRDGAKQQHSKPFLSGLKNKKNGIEICEKTQQNPEHVTSDVADLSPLLGMAAWDALIPPACSPSLCCSRRGVGVSSPSRGTELPPRSHCDPLLSGVAVTVWIAYFDCNGTGSSPTPNRRGIPRAQQTPAQ